MHEFFSPLVEAHELCGMAQDIDEVGARHWDKLPALSLAIGASLQRLVQNRPDQHATTLIDIAIE